MKIKEALTKAWNFLDGKKTVIGTIIWAVAGGLKYVPSMKPYSDVLQFTMDVGYIISIGGISHKALKTETGQKILNKFAKK